MGKKGRVKAGLHEHISTDKANDTGRAKMSPPD